MVASPELARAVRRGDEAALERYDLSPRERTRLETVAAQRGMEVSCTLYRANRLTPVVMLLPYTCFILGDRMKSIADRFWNESRTDLQFRNEIERFAAFLLELVRSGKLDEPLLEEVLAFELATMEPLPYDLEEGDFPLVLVAGDEELGVRQVDAQLAVLLEALDDGGLPLGEDDARLLIEAGLAVRG